jgi:hypothetical protein
VGYYAEAVPFHPPRYERVGDSLALASRRRVEAPQHLADGDPPPRHADKVVAGEQVEPARRVAGVCGCGLLDVPRLLCVPAFVPADVEHAVEGAARLDWQPIHELLSVHLGVGYGYPVSLVAPRRKLAALRQARIVRHNAFAVLASRRYRL